MKTAIRWMALWCGFLAMSQMPAARASEALAAKSLKLPDGRSVTFNLPKGYTFSVVADGFKRPRFFTKSPDGRIFLTSMYNLADNNKGAVYVLDGFDPKTGRVAKVSTWQSGLRNPNSVAFMKDATGKQWIYVALTDVLLRHPYQTGETRPSGAAQAVARFPDKGMSAANGGWHLTRTVVPGANGKLYVSVGSSCNACNEDKAEADKRAVVLEMNPDGSGSRVFARGLRNAVWMAFNGANLMATNQGVDHLGQNAPDETFYALKAGADYGWPNCYSEKGKVKADPKYPRAAGCSGVPAPMGRFDAHASALGFDYFDAASNSALAGSYVVALHGSGSLSLGHGYKLVRMSANGAPMGDFMTGFLRDGKVSGRPCGVLRVGRDAFLITDDKFGIVYYIHPE